MLQRHSSPTNDTYVGATHEPNSESSAESPSLFGVDGLVTIDEHPEVVAELRKAYDQWWEETIPLMVNEDAPYAPEQPQRVRYEKQLKATGIPDWKPSVTVTLPR